MCMNCTVMCVSICVKDAMGAVLSWFATRFFALVLDTADALKHWRVSKTVLCRAIAFKALFRRSGRMFLTAHFKIRLLSVFIL